MPNWLRIFFISNMNKIEEIKSIILNGISEDLFLAKRALQLSKEISKKHKNIEDPIKQDVSLILYDLTYSEIVLSLGRIYDNFKKKFPTRCLKRLYHLAKESDYVLEIDRLEIQFNFRSFNLPDHFKTLLLEIDDYEFRKGIIGHFQQVEINDPHVIHLNKLKNLRDKKVAHNEDILIEFDGLMPYESADHLIKHAEQVCKYFLLAYTGIQGHHLDDKIATSGYAKTYNLFIH